MANLWFPMAGKHKSSQFQNWRNKKVCSPIAVIDSYHRESIITMRPYTNCPAQMAKKLSWSINLSKWIKRSKMRSQRHQGCWSESDKRIAILVAEAKVSRLWAGGDFSPSTTIKSKMMSKCPVNRMKKHLLKLTRHKDDHSPGHCRRL